jgi:hypothetical protein
MKYDEEYQVQMYCLVYFQFSLHNIDGMLSHKKPFHEKSKRYIVFYGHVSMLLYFNSIWLV